MPASPHDPVKRRALTHIDLQTTLTHPTHLRQQYRGARISGSLMSSKSCLVLTAALLCSSFSAFGQTLPDGPGKELAAANCNSCHTLLSRVGAGYTPEGWQTVLRMMTNQGVEVPAEQAGPLREYLTKSFPEKTKPAGAIIP